MTTPLRGYIDGVLVTGHCSLCLRLRRRTPVTFRARQHQWLLCHHCAERGDRGHDLAFPAREAIWCYVCGKRTPSTHTAYDLKIGERVHEVRWLICGESCRYRAIKLVARLPTKRQWVCRKCGTAAEEMRQCAGCRWVRYCSAVCQKADWKTHKADCRPPPARSRTGTDAPEGERRSQTEPTRDR